MFKNLFVSAIVFFSVFSTVTLGWTVPVPVSELNTQYSDTLPFLASDGLTMYFSRNATDTFYYTRIYQATRTQPSGSFSNILEISSLNYSYGHVGRPWVSPDSLHMYYMRTESSGWKVKFAQRNSTSDTWLPGTNLLEINSIGQVSTPSLSADELTIAFTVKDSSGGLGNEDIVIGTRPNTTSQFSNFVYQNAINSSSLDGNLFLSPDALSIYFSSTRNGSEQLFKASRDSASDSFGDLEHLSFFDVPGANLRSPMLSSNGTEFYYTQSINNGPWDIYVSYIPEPSSIALFVCSLFMINKRVKC